MVPRLGDLSPGQRTCNTPYNSLGESHVPSHFRIYGRTPRQQCQNLQLDEGGNLMKEEEEEFLRPAQAFNQGENRVTIFLFLFAVKG